MNFESFPNHVEICQKLYYSLLYEFERRVYPHLSLESAKQGALS